MSHELEAPQDVTKKIKADILRRLMPKFSHVLLKFLIVHLFMSLVALLTCPQFGISLLVKHNYIAHILHDFGPFICSIFCGSYFFLLGSLLSLIFLNADEWRVLKSHYALVSFFMMVITLLTFALLGGAIFELLTLFWALGASLPLMMTGFLSPHSKKA